MNFEGDANYIAFVPVGFAIFTKESRLSVTTGWIVLILVNLKFKK